MGLRVKLTQALCEGVLLIGTSTLALAQESTDLNATQPITVLSEQDSNNQNLSRFSQQMQVSKRLLNHLLAKEDSNELKNLVLNIEYTKCREILERPSSLPFLIAWTDGYLSGVTRNTFTDEEYIQDLSKGIVTYCQKHPNALYWKYIQTYYNVSGLVQ